METQLVEYLYKNYQKRTDKKEERKAKRGVFYCGVTNSDSNRVSIGFSLCNPLDKYDYVDDGINKGFGLNLSIERSNEWIYHREYFIQTLVDKLLPNLDSENIVEIPPSIVKKLKGFIVRCQRYFKDKTFPEWCMKLFEDKYCI